MPKPTFDITGYRARLGLTQVELGEMLHLAGPRHIAAWEEHQRSNGRKEYGPSGIAIAHMELLEQVWRWYHTRALSKTHLHSVLPEKLLLVAPKRKTK